MPRSGARVGTLKFLTSDDLGIHLKNCHSQTNQINVRESIQICTECGNVDSEKRDLKEQIEEVNIIKILLPQVWRSGG